VEFSTDIIATSDIEFTLDVTEITSNSANITVTPSNSDYYFWTYISEMDYALYDDYAVMVNMISNITAEVANGASITDIIHSGASSQRPKSLWSGTQYHIIAWGIVAPALDILMYAEPASKVFLQGLVAGASNIVTTAIVGTILCIAYSAAKPKKGSLKEEQ
jgi:hypothetical protein